MDWFDDGLVEQIGWFEYWQTKPLDMIELVELVYINQKANKITVDAVILGDEGGSIDELVSFGKSQLII